MDWGALIGPAVVAAGVSGIISVISLIVTTWTARRLHVEKLQFDRDLAERKFTFDKDLAERKFRYDRELPEYRRRGELAEAVLADFYRVEEIYRAARDPVVPIAEMLPVHEAAEEDVEPEYAPLRRLQKHEEFLSNFRARKFGFVALFGQEAAAPFDEISKVHKDIVSAVRDVMSKKEARKDDATPEQRRWYLDRWSIIFNPPNATDEISRRIAAVVQHVEKICRPPIEAMVRS